MIKSAAAGDFEKCAQIVEAIRREDPSFWPHGVSPSHFDGGLWMVKESATSEPVGFVGWQERMEGPSRIGYYSIGILPAYRQRGFAKSAVSQVMREKAAGVDIVRALIMRHNRPSLELARALPEVQVKQAGAGDVILKALKGLASGTATASLIDLAVNKDKGAIGHYVLGREGADPWTAPDFALNFGAGALAPFVTKTLGGKTALVGGAAAKTIATPAVRQMARANDIAERAVEAQSAVTPSGEGNKELNSTLKALGLGALGLGGAGLIGAGISSWKKNRALKEQADAAAGGRIRITLPTKNPEDAETVMDIPIDEVNLSKSLRGRLGRDTRRRLLEETRKRTKKRSPKDPKKPTDAEKELAAVHAEGGEMDKAAGAAPPAVTSPPPMGVNPALRMTQEQMAAQQGSQAQTGANPQIQDAQMAAAQAQQEGQAQLQQAEQASQQKLMDAENRASQALAQAEHENQMLKMQVEKEKMTAELQKKVTDAEAKQAAGGTAADNSAVAKITERRLGRIQKMVKSSTAASPAPPTPYQPLAMGSAQKLNTPGAVAHGYLKPAGQYRVSMGKPLDMIYNALIRPMLYAAPAGAATAAPQVPPQGLLSRLRTGVTDTLKTPAL